MAHHQRPTAFFCANDGVAAKLLDELENLGYQVPDDVEVATVDDNQFVKAVDLPIVVASQKGYEMGCQSAEILIARTESPERPVEKRLLKADIIVPEKLRATRPRMVPAGERSPAAL